MSIRSRPAWAPSCSLTRACLQIRACRARVATWEFGGAPEFGGADPRRHSVSAFGKVRELNSPSILNVRFNSAGLNWTGRTPSLESQISESIPNADTMANSWPNVLAVLAKDADLVAAFTASYGDAPFANQKAVMDAIVTYERSLVTDLSRFDDRLRGDERALSHAERIGYQRFKEVGCVGCHNGINVGGGSFAKLGLFGDYFADRAAKGRVAAHPTSSTKAAS